MQAKAEEATLSAWDEEEHVRRLREWGSAVPPKLTERRRGLARQRDRRQHEHVVRRHVAALAQWTQRLGWTCRAIASRLRLAPRTLRQWQADLRDPCWHAQPLGRPTRRSSPRQRNAVIGLLDELGPALGVPTLRACFPSMARAELADLVRRYRRVWRKRQCQPSHVLSWLVPGRVWAIDFSEAPLAIDGRDEYLLAVRDLASGQQLWWLPAGNADTQAALAALRSLFARHGPPLVLKSDNGSAFGADAILDLLHQDQVVALFSPPYTPRYNGAIEAGIGSLKARTHQQATRHGHPGFWTYDDIEGARLEANATARPHGPAGPSPDEAWNSRRPLTALERASFYASVERLRQEVRRVQGRPMDGELSTMDHRALDRIAIRRALCEHGYLLFSRRPIPLPIRKRKVTDIT